MKKSQRIENAVYALMYKAIPWWEYEEDQESTVCQFAKDVQLNYEIGGAADALDLLKELKPWCEDTDLESRYNAVVALIKQ